MSAPLPTGSATWMASGPSRESLSDRLRRIVGAARPDWCSPTALALIAANLLPLYGVLALGWDVLPIMVLFWLENIVIGALNIPRILLAGEADSAKWPARFMLALFFTFHYGLFTAVHGLFVFTLFGGTAYHALVHDLWTFGATRQAIEEFSLWPALGALTVSHLFSFIWNYLGRREFQKARPGTLMHAPYSRVMVLHVTIIFGGLLVQLLDSPLWSLLLLVGLKISIDLRAHLREHRERQTAGNPGSLP
jgi:hypothetical protein